MESIEWLTADADLVVHGTFVKFQRGVDVGPTGRRWDRGTVLVNEVLKGERPKSRGLTFAVPASDNWPPPRWDEPGAECLFFLVNSKRVRPDVAPDVPPPCQLALQIGAERPVAGRAPRRRGEAPPGGARISSRSPGRASGRSISST